MALDTIRLVMKNIYAVDKNPKDLKAREGLMLAATLGRSWHFLMHLYAWFMV